MDKLLFIVGNWCSRVTISLLIVVILGVPEEKLLLVKGLSSADQHHQQNQHQVMVEDVITSCSEYATWNGCKNPFEAKCDPLEGKCFCKEPFSLYEGGYCLRRLLAINEPCWIDSQCLMVGTRCFSKEGKTDSIDLIVESLWDDYINSNGSELIIPGLCQCNIGYVFDLVESKCIPRLIDTPCLSNYDCLRRSPFSRCFINKCNCSPRHLYNARSDKCVFFGEVLWPRRSCFEGSCRGGGGGIGASNGNGSPGGNINSGEQYFYNHSMANIFGFSLSMTVLMMVWIVVRNFARSRLSDRVIRLDELRYSDLRVAYDPFELNRPSSSGLVDIDSRSIRSLRRETLPTYEDIQPPSYEEAIVKLTSPSTTLTTTPSNLPSDESSTINK